MAAGVLFVDADRFGAQARHAEAVVGKQVIRQRDGLLVLPLVIVFAGQQAVGVSVQNDRAFRLVKAELIIRSGVRGIKGDVEGRVVADAKAQFLGTGVAHAQGVVHGLAVQPEGAGEHKVKGEALGFYGFIRAQLQLDGIALGLEQGMLHIAGKAMLAALVGLALCLKSAAGQLARPGEQDGGVALPHRRVGLPQQLFACCVFQADSLCTVGVHGQGQKFVVNGCLHCYVSFL